MGGTADPAPTTTFSQIANPMTAPGHRLKCRKVGLSGFTLIELIAVIAIVAVLAGLLMSAITAARRQTRKAVARSEIKNLETAWRQYYAEYQTWPTFAAESSAVAITGTAARVLHGENLDGNNRKLLTFMEFGAINVVTNPVNPWGDPDAPSPSDYYYVKFDTDYDNVIAKGTAGEPPDDAVRRPVIVWTTYLDDKGDSVVIGSWQ